MNSPHQDLVISSVLSLLDIIVVMLLKDDPVIWISLTVLLKTVTKDKIIHILLILLTIVLSEASKD